MKRKSLLFLMLAALFAPLAMNGQTQNQLLSENFDSWEQYYIVYQGDSWFAYNASSNANNWGLYNDETIAHSGTKAMGVQYNQTYAADCYLVSEPFTVSANMTKLTASLWERVYSSSYAETFEVFFIKASDVTSGPAIATATHYTAISTASYTNETYAQKTGDVIDSALAGQSVRVVVHCTSAADKYYLFIDDIVVTETTSGGGQGDENSLTVCDGTATSQGIPMYGFYFDDYTKSECIIPASDLTAMNGATITAITFYPSSVSSRTWNGSEQTVFLKEVSGTTLNGSYSGTSGATTVKVGSPLPMPTANQAYTITFDTPYTYNGGNLLIGVYNDDGSNYNDVSWYGTNDVSSGVSAYGYNGSSLSSATYNAQQFLPKTTFTYTLPSGFNVNAGTMSNGSIQFSINGGYDWYDNLSNVPAGETVVISVQPETGYVSGTPTVTPASGTAPTVSGSGNNYSFVMPESDVTVNVTFNCTTPADPTFSVASGTYTSVQNVSISCATAGATIYYTTDGSTPTNSSTQYTGAITINSTTTLKAIAYIGTCLSNVVTATYTMDLPTYTVICATGLTGGSLSASPASAVEGTTITITATAESGYFLGTIIATDANNNDVPVTVSGNQGTFTMPASNVTVTATFTQGYNVTLVQTDHGIISVDGATTNLQPGDYVVLTATADANCIFKAWYVYKTGSPRDVIAVIEESSYSWFVMPSSDVTAQAIFVTETEHESTVGSGSGTNQYVPTSTNQNYSLTQQIYTAAEIGYEGRITAIAFKCTGNQTIRTLDIFMAHTDKTSFSSTNDWETMGVSDLVYSGSVTFTRNNWATITLNTPFEYDGVHNLNICVSDRTASTTNSARTFSTYSTNANRALCISGTNSNWSTDGPNFSSYIAYSNYLSDFTGTYNTSNNQIKFTIKVPGSAESLTLSPDAINDFSYVEGQGPSQAHKLGIVGVDLQNDVTLTAPTNFEISMTENGTYTSSLTIQRETASKGNRAATNWDFEDGLGGWTSIDADADGFYWTHTTDWEGHDGSTGCVYSLSYDNDNETALEPDNQLISPSVTLGGTFSMWAKGEDPMWPYEHFGIYVSTDDGENFAPLGMWTLSSGNWKQYSVDLGNYAGQEGYIMVRHFNCSDNFAICVDDFVLDTDAAITVEMPVVMTLETVFVRMKDNLDVDTYSGTLTASAGTGDNLNGSVSLSGEVVAPSYTVTLSANPGEGGRISGFGTYTDGTSVTVTATATSPYQFINWTENGTVVSTDASYTFTVTGDRNLVANFGFIKHITGYDNDGGYNLIASPIGDVAPDDVTNMTTAKFDLYRFNASAAPLEWENYKQHHFGLVVGRGYLYAHNTDVDLVFMGSAYNNSENRVSVPLDAFDNHEFDGWNLVGNPFAVDAHIVTSEGHTLNFFTLNESASNEYIAVTNPSVEAMEGVFVYAEAEKDTIIFVKGDVPEAKSSQLALNVNSSRNLVDRAIVRFDECRQLPKFQLNRNSTKVYIPMEGKDYAVVRGEEMGELPVNFKAEENGHYSLNLSNENVEFAYLHLIDNMTGNEVDLLQTPSYSFEAKTTDYESRFKLVYATGNNSNSDNFAYYSNGSFVINNDGAAELQVIDVMGRIMKSESINGCANVSVNGATGVYMLRLVNGDNVKVQKVVVK